MEVCRLENITKTYQSQEEIMILNDISLSIKKGDFVCIQGPSGIGKSTLMYIMGGLLEASSGEVFIDNKSLNNMNDKEITSIRRDKIGFVFQDNNMIQALTVEENILFMQSIGGKKKDYKKVEQLLNRLGLFERKDYLPSSLSGGQRRRLMIACALIKEPILILADEPTNDLDSYWTQEVINLLIENSNNGSGLVIVTHNTEVSKKASLRFKLNNGALKTLD